MRVNAKTRNSALKRYLVIILILLMFIVAISVRISIIPKSNNIIKGSTDDKVKIGLKYLTAYSEIDVAAIEKKVEEVERKRKAELIEKGDMNAIFASAMIMGDSHMEGVSTYGLLDASRVAAVKGRSLANCSEDIQKVINMSPSVIFMNYGMNDAMNYGSNVDSFINKYKSVITSLQQALPSSKIVICSIFPAKSDVFGRKPALANIPKYNQELEKMCKDMKLTFIDTTSLMTDEVYEPDHIHTNAAFHKTWLGYVADEAGLLDLQ